MQLDREIAENNKILKITAGSQLYGTNTPDSDEDYSGVFIGGFNQYFGIYEIDEMDLSIEDKGEDGKNTKDATDYKLYEIKNFARLCASNNPNIIEHLFVNRENIKFINEFGEMLLENAHIFPHKGAYDKFIGYANSQKHKMVIKLDNFEQLTKAQEFFSLQEPNEYVVMFRDDPQVQKFFKEKGSHFIIGDLNFQKHLMVKKVLGVLNERLGKITNRHELVLKYGYDTKFASHLIRLLSEGGTLLETGKLEFPLYNADLMLEIKKGKYELPKLLELADEFEKKMADMKEKSSLPDGPDMRVINDFVRTMTMQFFGIK